MWITCLWCMRYGCDALTRCKSVTTMNLRVFKGTSQFSECWWKDSGGYIGTVAWIVYGMLGALLQRGFISTTELCKRRRQLIGEYIC